LIFNFSNEYGYLPENWKIPFKSRTEQKRRAEKEGRETCPSVRKE